MNYLTESTLKEILQKLFPDQEIIHDKSVPNSKYNRMRPDFRFENLKIIIEFDGDTHYTSAERILNDKLKDEDYTSLGYKVFRIPYFIQMSEELLYMIFDAKIEYNRIYNDGFIDSKVKLPADFCELGVIKFLEDLEKFDYAKSDIIETLKDKISEKKDVARVLPLSLKDTLISSKN